MTGRAEVHRLRQQLDASFARAARLRPEEGELLSDFARYLCIRVSGFLEQAVTELVLEYVRRHADESILGHIEQRLRQTTNLKSQKLITLMGGFKAEWRVDLEGFIVDERKDALDGIVDLRNRIAHGHSAGITMSRIREYYGRILAIVDHVGDLCVPL